MFLPDRIGQVRVQRNAWTYAGAIVRLDATSLRRSCCENHVLVAVLRLCIKLMQEANILIQEVVVKFFLSYECVLAFTSPARVSMGTICIEPSLGAH